MTTFGSARAALAYHFACRRGPQMSRPRWHDAPPSTGRTPWDHVEVGALLHGPEDEGLCGVVPGSELDDELQRWAEGFGVELSADAQAVARRLGQLLAEHGLTTEPAPDRAALVVWTYPDGTRGRRMRDALELAVLALQQALALGPRPSAEVRRELQAMGFSARTLQRALDLAGVIPDRTPTVPARTLWRLGATADATQQALPAT